MNDYEEIRRLSATALRELCIRQDWYTSGDNADYGHLLLDLAGHKQHLATGDIIAIAEDIAAHTDPQKGWTVESIAAEVVRACSVAFRQSGQEAPPAIGYMDGPWRNDACMGYAVMALRRAGISERTVQKAVTAMWYCFDDKSVEDAAAYYRAWQG